MIKVLSEEEISNLELEMKSCLVAASELSRNDAIMSNNIREVVEYLRNKANEIKRKLEENEKDIDNSWLY